ncbi:MAG TPA: hypothetical protein VH518_09960 [Tepidisphaeraceae bacterium]
MKRPLVIFAVAWFLSLGTGAVEYLHNAQHAREDAQRSRQDPPAPAHDESNCPVHAQLHQPLIVAPAVVLLICAGIFVAFISQLAPAFHSLRIPSRIDCRGPPPLVV